MRSDGWGFCILIFYISNTLSGSNSKGTKRYTVKSHFPSICRGLVFVSIQPLCVLIGAFTPFTFKVTVDMYVLIDIL